MPARRRNTVPPKKKTPGKPSGGATAKTTIAAGKGYAVPQKKDDSPKTSTPKKTGHTVAAGKGWAVGTKRTTTASNAAHSSQSRSPHRGSTTATRVTGLYGRSERPSASDLPRNTGGVSPSSASSHSANNTSETPRLRPGMAKKYKKLLEASRKTVDGKKMTNAQVRKIKDDRKKLKALRKNLVSQGYGSLSKEENKKGGHNAHGIYKALSGKKYTPSK